MNKGLEALKDIENELQFHYQDIDVYNITKFPREINIIEKELKALEVIRNKGAFVYLLRQSENVEVYNSCMIVAFKEMAKKDYEGVVKKFCLTQEEFNLLKEVLL